MIINRVVMKGDWSKKEYSTIVFYMSVDITILPVWFQFQLKYFKLF